VAKHVVPGRLDLGPREGIVLDLGFLNAKHIRLMLGEPRHNAIESLANRVDVPGGDLHADTGREKRTP
jgi:hypothetical protein